MIREIIQEKKEGDIVKYLPKKLQKLIKTDLPQAKMWVEAMDYPLDSGYYGHYGKKAGEKLEFNVKTSLEYDYDEYTDVEMESDDYYEMGREDLAESLRSEFGVDVYGYDGRSGGYLLLEDYDNAIFGGTGVNDVYTDEGYISEVQDYIDEVERLISDLDQEGPTGEDWDDYVADLEYTLDDGAPYDTSINKNYAKIIRANYKKLEKFIEDSVKGYGKGFADYLKNNYGK